MCESHGARLVLSSPPNIPGRDSSFIMLYLSQVLGRPVRDVEGEGVATIKDVVVHLGEDHPPVTGLVARYGRREFDVPRARVAQFGAPGARRR